MKYLDRNGKMMQENEGQERILKRLYGSAPGRFFLKLLICPVFSKLGGFMLNTGISAYAIGPFIRKYRIDMSDYEKRTFHSFNAFFCRKILPGKRPAAEGEDVLISPCDGKLSCYPIAEDSRFRIKHSVYTLESLLKNRKLAEHYKGGWLLVFRLTVEDYHHFCYIADGRKTKNIRLPGVLHTVNPIAVETVPVYQENARQYSLLKTRNFGTVMVMEVGAMLVGRIVNLHEAAVVKKGEEKGWFEFGGSTVILCFQKGRIRPDDDLCENSRAGMETAVRLGERIGKCEEKF